MARAIESVNKPIKRLTDDSPMLLLLAEESGDLHLGADPTQVGQRSPTR